MPPSASYDDDQGALGIEIKDDEVFHSPQYQRYLDYLCWYDHVFSLDGYEKLIRLKVCIRIAALMTRSFLQINAPEDIYIRSQTFGTIARVVWQQDVELARRMSGRDLLARRFLDFSSPGVVNINDLQSFGREVDASRTAVLDARQIVSFAWSGVVLPVFS